MEFGLSEEQRLLGDSVAKMLEDASPLDHVREAAANRTQSAAVQTALTDLGAPALLVPEEFGGLGLGMLDAALIQEALGGHVSPASFTGSGVMATVGIVTAGTDEQKAAYLPKIASGEARFGVAVSEKTGARLAAGVTAEGGKLNGQALFALDTDGASHIIVADKDGGLHVVDAGADGLSHQDLKTIDRTRIFRELTLANVAATPLSAENEQGLACRRMVDAGRIMLAADTLGAGQEMIRQAVEYAKERKQFNRVIASFQAVKHMCAEMAAELEPCRSLVWYAAHAFDHIPEESSLMACHAKSHLSEVGRFVARTATEVHGGMGFTDLLGLHYWFKRIGANRQILGGPEAVRAEAAKLQGWGEVA